MHRKCGVPVFLALSLFLLLYAVGGLAGEWQPTSTEDAAASRYRHTAISVDGNMLVYGGYYPVDHFLNDGHWYYPITDTWKSISTQNAPIGRLRHTAVWTGTEMIVWGGESAGGGATTNTGGRYDPDTDSWTSTSLVNAPSAREMHSAVWTGSEMIVWGGCSTVSCGVKYNDGGRYDPVTDTWTPITGTLELTASFTHQAAWTGDRMIVWGGSTDPQGMSYDPATSTWTPITTTNAPPPTYFGASVWTGEEMIVWGGCTTHTHGTPCTSHTNNGGRYNAATDTWTPVSPDGAPAARLSHTAVWTGQEMLVWGGCGTECYDTGGVYNPASDTWGALDAADAPTPRAAHVAVWTGETMVVWGGCGSGYCSRDVDFLDTGGRFTHPPPAPLLTISKAGPATATPGDLITYTLTVSNSGGLASNLVITDAVPLNAHYVSGGQLVGSVISWTVPSCNPSHSLTRTFTVSAPQSITNHDYRVSADGNYSATGQIDVVTIIAPDLSIGKTGPMIASPGDLITYTLTVSNSGGVATSLLITDAMPLNTHYVSGGQLVGNVISWIVPSLNPSESLTRTFTVTATQSITNSRYRVSADGNYSATGQVDVVTLIQPPAPAPPPTPYPLFLPTILRATPRPSEVRITYIEYNPPGDEVAGEYVRIVNSGETFEQMTGWTLRDIVVHTFTFPSFALNPKAFVRVWTKSGANTATDLYWSSGAAIWNNEGDCAYLRNGEGTLVSTFCY